MYLLKKQISLAAAATMIVSMLTAPAHAATPKQMPNDYSEWVTKVNVNFDDYADVNAAKEDGMKIQASEDCVAIGATTRGKSVGLLNCTDKSSGIYYALDTAVNSGQVKIMFSANTTTLCTQPINVFADAASPTAGQEVITFSQNLSSLVFKNKDTGKRFTKGEWVDVTILADFDTGKMTSTFFGPGMDVSSPNSPVTLYSRTDDLTMEAIAGICFRNWWKDTGDNTSYVYFDNIKIATREKLNTSTNFAKEDFEEFDYVHEIFANGWDAVGGWDNGTAQNYLVGPTRAELVNSGAGYGKSLRFTQANQGFKKPILTKNGEPVSKGFLKVDFSIYSEDATKTKIFAYIGNETKEQQIIYFAPNLIQKDSRTAANQRRYASDTWYDVSTVIDIANQNYTVTVTSDGNPVDEFTNNLDSAITDISTFRIHKWDPPVFRFDNFSITEYEPPKPSTAIMSEDFEGGKTLAERGWVNKNSVIASIDSENGNRGKLEIDESEGKAGGISKSFTQVTEGKIRTVFTAEPNDNKFYVKMLGKNNSNNDAAVDAIYITGSADGNLMLPSTGSAWDDQLSANYTAGMVYRVENIYDMDSKTRTLSVYNASTGDLIQTKEYSASGTTNADKQLASINSITGIEVMNWGYGDSNKNTRGSKPAYIDDIVVEYVVDKPELSASRIQFIDYKGNAAADKNAVTTALDKIVLDFGCNVYEETIDGAVTLTKDGANVPFTASFDSAKRHYTIVPDNYLDPSSEYVLRVADTVENKFGYQMETAFEMTFKTAASAVIDGNIESVKANNINEITHVSDIADGQNINISGTFVNSSSENKTLTFVIAYYSGNELVNVDICENQPIAAKTKSPISAVFTAPADMTGIDEVAVFVWDNLTNIAPYAPAKVIE